VNSKNKTTYYTSFPTPIGRIYLAGTSKGLCRVSWGYRSEKDFVREVRSLPVSFKKYALVLEGTVFQKKVWRVLADIQYGKVLTYKEVAKKIGFPGASRAAGSACGKNELPILIPCHRVISSDGSLGGFSGGLRLKRYLLELEGVKI